MSDVTIRRLIPQLYSYSQALEADYVRARFNTTEALSWFSELDAELGAQLNPQLNSIALSSLVHDREPAAAKPAPQTAKPAVTPPQRVRTSRQEYRPALDRADLIQALLDYQRRKGVRDPHVPKVLGSTTYRHQQLLGPSGFSPATIPEIEAEPKPSALDLARTPGVRVPVLRTKADPCPS